MRSSARPLVAVAVEASDEVPAVLMAESDRDILGGHLQLVDHVPAGEMPRHEVETAVSASGGPYGLPVVGAGAWGPVLAAQRDEAEISLARQPQERGAGVCGQRRLAPQMVLRRVEPPRRRAELLSDDDPVAVEVDPLPPQRVQLPRTQAGERGDLEPRRERRGGQPVSVGDDLPDLLRARKAAS
jgi:hypothetical protein